MLKGDPSTKEFVIVYPSGKREGKNKRIAYTHEELNEFQLSNGDLKKPEELKGQTYVIFAVPNTFYPVNKDWYVRAHPSSIAKVHGGRLTFASSSPEKLPFLNADRATIDETRQAATK